MANPFADLAASEMMSGVVSKESGFSPDAVSTKGAIGPAQLTPETAQDMGVKDINNPFENIQGGEKRLSQLLEKYHGNRKLALAAYNWGPANVDKYGIEKAPKETRDYVNKLLGDGTVPEPTKSTPAQPPGVKKVSSNSGDNPFAELARQEDQAQHYPEKNDYAAPRQPEDTGLLSGFGKRVDRMLSSGARLADKTPYQQFKDIPTHIIGMAGQEAAMVGDVGGAVISTLTPDFVKSLGKDALEYVASTKIGKVGLDALKSGSDAWEKWSKKNPDIAEAIVAIPNIAGAVATLEGAGAAINGVGAAVKKAIPSSVPKSLYQSAAKFSTTLPPEERTAITNTLLNEKIPLSESGYAKLDSKIHNLNQQIKEKISSVSDQRIDPTKATVWVKEAIGKAENTLEKGKNLQDINDVVDSFIKDHGDLTVSKAQKIKQDIYKKLKSNYDAFAKTGVSKYDDGTIAAMKNIARGLKEEVASAAPGVADLNTRESSLLKAEPHLRRATNRVGNHNILSLDDVLATGVAEMVGGPGAALGMGIMKKVLGAPQVKSKIAIVLNSLKNPNLVPKAKIAEDIRSAVLSSGSSKELVGVLEEAGSPDPKEAAAAILEEVKKAGSATGKKRLPLSLSAEKAQNVAGEHAQAAAGLGDYMERMGFNNE